MSAIADAVDAELIELLDEKDELMKRVGVIDDKVSQLSAFRADYLNADPETALPKPQGPADPPPSPKPTEQEAKAKKVKEQQHVAPKSARPKSPRQASSQAVKEREELVMTFLAQRTEPILSRDLFELVAARIDDLSKPQFKSTMKNLLASGRVKFTGATKSLSYFVPGAATDVPEPEKRAPSPLGATTAEIPEPQPIEPATGRQAPTLDGKILAVIQAEHLSSGLISDKVDATVEKVREALYQLEEDGTVKNIGASAPFDKWALAA